MILDIPSSISKLNDVYMFGYLVCQATDKSFVIFKFVSWTFFEIS